MKQFVNHKTGSDFPVKAITVEVDKCIAIFEGTFKKHVIVRHASPFYLSHILV